MLKDESTLLDIVQAAGLVKDFIRDMTKEAFLTNIPDLVFKIEPLLPNETKHSK
jgi:uncharacterized protein with HEPN domain